MMRSLYSAVSGLRTHQTKMDVIGNNVSNVNTVAFKASTVTFNELMYQTISGATGANAATGKGGVNAKQIGLGVTMGSTNVNITGAGSAESTGRALDIRLSDKSTTNFFVVNNGSENLFTRAGSFYLDGSGNLCMSSTGYTVMGWQVDPTTGTIRKDTVSALQVMNEKNQTSPAEATEKASVGGLLDKNDSNLNGDGYTMVLNFYDNLGYSYQAKFAVKVTDPKTEAYTVELSDIVDTSSGKSVLTEYLSKPGNSLSQIFGKNTTSTSSYDVTDSDIKYTDADIFQADGVTVAIPAGSYYKRHDTYNPSGDRGDVYELVTLDPTNNKFITAGYRAYASKEDAIAGTETVVGGDDPAGTMTDLFGISAQQLGYLNTPAGGYSAALVNGKFQVTGPATNYDLKFDPDNGTFSYVGDAGSKEVKLNLAATLGNQFADITIDFSQCLSSNNGGKMTMGVEPGIKDANSGIIDGKGKPIGALTDIIVDNYGKIYGAYNNGNTVLLGQIAVAQFANASGLEKVGNNCYRTTLNSGDFDGVGVEIAADGSSMSPGELEMSNVDLSSEFTQMIITQRGYQANSRVITTSDTLLEELINLKR